MDDVHTKSKTHIGTVVIPAAWGLAEYLGKCGQDFILAVMKKSWEHWELTILPKWKFQE